MRRGFHQCLLMQTSRVAALRGNRAEVYRCFFQVWTRPLADDSGEAQVVRQAQGMIYTYLYFEAVGEWPNCLLRLCF